MAQTIGRLLHLKLDKLKTIKLYFITSIRFEAILGVKNLKVPLIKYFVFNPTFWRLNSAIFYLTYIGLNRPK